MNKQFLRHIALTALLSLPVIGGCKPADAPPAAPGTNATPAVPGVTNAAKAAVAEAVQPEVPFAVERPIPENLNPSVPLKEVIKLAQAGVDEEVLLSFVNGSTSGFSVGADEIIYLTDIGVPATVINSMMERDKALKTANATAVSATVTAPAATATPTVAAAPSYVQPPTQTETASEPVEASVTEGDFNDALSPYGTWIDIEGYGRCWQPTVVVVNRNWRPYCDGGRWMYTDAGWYWYSDYTWGWAPFHYGRWFSHPRWGWCWNPGYTWGPAWVTWSYTDTYCGWAPLPPAAVYTGAGFTYCGSSVSVSFGFGLGYACYSYVPWRNFCDYRPWRYCAPRPHCKEIYDRATCHNDYSWDRNRRAVNRGLPPERVSSYARTEIKRVSLREVSEPRTAGRREELARDGRTLEYRRPAAPTVTSVVGSSPTRSASVRNNAGIGSAGAQPTSTPRSLQRAQPMETASHVNSSARHPENGRAENPAARPPHSGGTRPLVVVGNGDGQPPTPSTWNPYQDSQQHTRREELAAVAPAQVDGVTEQPNAGVHQWNHPTRPEVTAPQSQIIRVGRGIEDRPAGGPSYRVYSSPQRQAPTVPSYGPPPTVDTQTSSRPSHSPPSRSDDDNNSSSSYQQPSRQPTYEAPRQVERPAQQNNAPQRPTQSESRPAHVESRPASEQRSAPARSESSRSESRPDSRPAQSDSGRGSRNR